MDHIRLHPLLSTCFNNYPNESLREKVDFFLDFVENHPNPDREEAEDLLMQITDVVRMAEDRIEVEAADRVRDESTERSKNFLADLHKRIEEMDVIKEKVMKAKEETEFITRQPKSSMPPSSSSDLPAISMTTTMVGFDGYLEQLLDQLTGYPSDRKRIIPIVGMGGIGKTTLAQKAYENFLTANYFDVCAWVTVSQDFIVSKVLSQLISCLGRSTSETNTNVVQLGEKLSKTLYCRRYLTVLDDVWSMDAWEKIMIYFPENNNGSRIIITTRQLEVVDNFDTSALGIRFLDNKNSWELFCQKIFAQGCCPPELQEVGSKIVKRCKGLPLAIVVIAGLLEKSSRTREYWEEVEKDRSLILNSGEGNEALSILHLSYNHMPICLRPCFLYLGLFPEDDKINVSELVKLWVAEGFIKPNKNQSLEEVGESYLTELIHRNLLLVSVLRGKKKLIEVYIHDLVRDLCMRIAKKENFFCIERDIDTTGEFLEDETATRFFPHTSLIRPLTFLGQRSRLLRVLHPQIRVDYLGFSLEQVNLRYLSQHLSGSPSKLLPSISLVWSLQTLVLTGGPSVVMAPHEIWKMPQLRHILTWLVCIPDPPSNGDVLVLQNLQTLKKAKNLNFTEEVCERIPNIKDLHIECHYLEQGEQNCNYNLQNIGCLNELESLYYSRVEYKYVGYSLFNLKLPSSLKVLSLNNCKLVQRDMTMISLLPRLEILELVGDLVVGGGLDFFEHEFRCLKSLEIGGCDDLIRWIGDSSNFPMLETLSLWDLSKLEEIPSDIGEIPTLELICIYLCSDSAIISAINILEEQESLGNMDLQVRVVVHNADRDARKKFQELGLKCQNLCIGGM